jgi:hypothetical protein
MGQRLLLEAGTCFSQAKDQGPREDTVSPALLLLPSKKLKDAAVAGFPSG